MGDVVNIAEYLAADFRSKHQDIISEGILPAGCRIIVGGMPKVGKTNFVGQMSFELATAEPFMGRFDIPKPRKVLSLQQEIPNWAFQERLAAMRPVFNSLRNDDNFVVFQGEDGKLRHDIRLDSPLGQGQLRKLVMTHKPDVLVLDPLYKLMIGDENRQTDIMVVLNYLDILAADYNLSIILVHHFKKPATDRSGKPNPINMFDLRGHSALPAWADTMILLTEKPHDQVVVTFVLRHGKEEPETLVLTRRRATCTFEAEIQGKPTAPIETEVLKLLKANKGEMDYQALLGKSGYSDSHTRRGISALRQKRIISITGHGKTKRSIVLLDGNKDEWYELA